MVAGRSPAWKAEGTAISLAPAQGEGCENSSGKTQVVTDGEAGGELTERGR